MTQLVRVLICLLVLGLGMYFYIDKINEQTQLRMQIPKLEKELEELAQKNIQLGYQLEHFNNPQHLHKLAQRPEYSHLKFPFMEEVMVVSSKVAKRDEKIYEEMELVKSSAKVQWPIYLGTSRR